MTYEEAQLTLKRKGDSHKESGVLFINRVSPLKQSDSINFSSTLREREVSEEEMKSMSTDNQFEVRSFRASTFPNA